jgi:hypothetical protein
MPISKRTHGPSILPNRKGRSSIAERACMLWKSFAPSFSYALTYVKVALALATKVEASDSHSSLRKPRHSSKRHPRPVDEVALWVRRLEAGAQKQRTRDRMPPGRMSCSEMGPVLHRSMSLGLGRDGFLVHRDLWSSISIG